MRRVLNHAGKKQNYKQGRDHKEECTRHYSKESAANLPSEVRDQILPEYDGFDADSSHIICMIAALRMKGMEVPEILKEIVKNKQEIRERIAEQEGISISEAKARLTAITYGSTREQKSEKLREYAITIRELAPILVSNTDLAAAKKRLALKKGSEHKGPIFSALSALLCRIEWQIIFQAQMFAQEKGCKLNNNIYIYDEIQVYRSSNNDKEITTEFLDELSDYIKDTLNVSVTFSGESRKEGETISVPTTRTFRELKGKPLLFIDKLSINKKRQLPKFMENDKRPRIEEPDFGSEQEGFDVEDRNEGNEEDGSNVPIIKSGVIDDVEAAEVVYKRFPNIKYDDEKIYVFDEKRAFMTAVRI